VGWGGVWGPPGLAGAHGGADVRPAPCQAWGSRAGRAGTLGIAVDPGEEGAMLSMLMYAIER
jgi:hypothetical protein